MNSLIWEAYQQQKVAGAERSAEVAVSVAKRQRDEIEGLEQQIEHLTLVCQAMWELIRDRTDFSEEHLEQKVIEIDVRDERLDGKIQSKLIQCPQCNRNNSTRRRNCVICGAFLDKEHIFEN
jgi:hypothetical protein